MDKYREYLNTKVMTSSKEQLLLMLFDGALRFSRDARLKMEEKNLEASNGLLQRAQRIVLELLDSLDRNALAEEVYDNLSGLYRFIHTRLLRANMTRELIFLDEAIKILEHLRETWALAIENDRKGHVGELASVAAEHLPKEGEGGSQAPFDIQG